MLNNRVFRPLVGAFVAVTVVGLGIISVLFHFGGVPFPTTGLIDNFNRANAGPQPSASWSQGPLDFTASEGLVVSGNQLARNSTGSSYQDSYWSNVQTSSGNSEAYATVASVPSGTCGSQTPALDHDLGTNTISNSSGTTITRTTTVAASSATEIIDAVWWNSNTVTASVSDNSGNGYTWSALGSRVVDGAGQSVELFATYATNGLASGTVITATFSSAVTYKMISAVSYTGIASSSSTDVTNTNSTGSQTTWNGAAVTTTNASDLVFAVAETNGVGQPTDTPGSGWTEVHDFNMSGQVAMTTVYQVESSTGTYTPSGTWSSSQTGAGQGYVTAALKAAPAAGTCGTVDLYARLGSIGSGTTNGYRLQVTYTSAVSLNTWEIDKITNGTATIIGSTVTQAVSAGDKVGFSLTGSSLKAYYQPTGGSWRLLFTQTDATYSSAGYLGVGITGTQIKLDDFSGGPLAGGVVADYYVDPINGSDSNTGTSGSPFLTMNKCAQQQTSAAITCALLGTGTAAPQTISTSRTADVTFVYASGADVQIGAWVHDANNESFTVGSSYTITLANGETTDGFPQDTAGNCPNVGVACYKLWQGGGAFQCTGKTSTTFTGCKDVTAQNGAPSPWSNFAGIDIHPGVVGLNISGNHIKVSGLHIGDWIIAGANDTVDGGDWYFGALDGTFDTLSNSTKLTTHGGSAGLQIGDSSSTLHDLTITNSSISNTYSDKCGTSGAYACHAEGVHVQCLDGALAFTRDTFYANDIFSISFQKGGGCANWVGPITVINNFVDCRWSVQGGDGSGGPEVRTCSGASLAWDTTNTGGGNTVYDIEYNSGYPQTNDTSTSLGGPGFGAGSIIRGNISIDTSIDCTTAFIAANSCSHNIYNRGGSCPGSADDGTSVCSHIFSSDFVNATILNLDLTGGAYPLLKGDAAHCPTVDIHGTTRNAAHCDAGADQSSG